MKVFHVHFGEDDAHAPVFVHLLNALAERGFEQKAHIQIDRPWRKLLHPLIAVTQTHFEPRSMDRFFMPMRIRREIRRWRPAVAIAWTAQSAGLLPAAEGPFRLARLDAAPENLKAVARADVLVCSTPAIAEAVRRLGWDRPVEVVADFAAVPGETAQAGTVNAFIEVMMARG